MGSGIGCLLLNLEGFKIEKVVQLGFNASNNKTEYKDLIHALKVVEKQGDSKNLLFIDSKLHLN